MKKKILLLTFLGLVGCALGLASSQKSQQVSATTVIDGGKAWTYDSTTSSALYFKMEENTAPYNDWNIRYKPLSVDSIVVIKQDGTERRLPEANLNAYEAICKFNPTSYYLEQWFFNDGTTGKLEIGDSVQLNGQFRNQAYDTIISITKSEFYISSKTNVLTFSESLEAIKDDFVGKYNELFEYELYEPTDYQALRDIEATLSNAIENAAGMKEVYLAFENAKAQASLIEKSPDGFINYQNNKKEEIRNYVSLDNYLPAEQAVVQGIINDCCDAIDDATTTSEIKALLAKAKEDINAVQTRTQAIENKVLNKEAGYEQYIESYDQVTLNDLNLGNSVTFHGLKSERDDEINTNITEGNMYNTFVPNEKNTKGNLIFNFTYQSNCKTNYGANMFVNLRGVKYYGFKFAISTDSQGMYFSRCFSDESTFVWGNSDYLTDSSKEYHISIGSIDLVEGNRTWIFIIVDGVTLYNAMTDSNPVAVNPRVSLSNNDDSRGDKEGITTISNYYPSDYESKISPIYGGIFKYDSANTSNMTLTLEENEVKFDANKKVLSYATNQEDIKLIRGSNEYNLANSNMPIIAKYSETSYLLYLSSLLTGEITSINNNDKLIINGIFTYFDEDIGGKVSYKIMESIFVYSGSSWSQELSLSAYKVDTINKVNKYLNESFLANYDEAEQNTIKGIVNATVSDINDATSIETVDNLYASFKSQIGAVLTSLQKYQEGKVEILSNYVSGKQSLYRVDDWDDITAIIKNYSAKIRASSTTKEADQLLDEGLKAIDSILTIEEHEAEELSEAKYNAIAEIRNHYGQFDFNNMSDEEIASLNADTQRAISEIESAEDIDSINRILNNFKSSHPLPSKDEPAPAERKWWQFCGGNIVVSSISLTLLSLSGLGLLLYKKRKMMEDIKK